MEAEPQRETETETDDKVMTKTGTKVETAAVMTAAYQIAPACAPTRDIPALLNLALANEM